MKRTSSSQARKVGRDLTPEEMVMVAGGLEPAQPDKKDSGDGGTSPNDVTTDFMDTGPLLSAALSDGGSIPIRAWDKPRPLPLRRSSGGGKDGGTGGKDGGT